MSANWLALLGVKGGPAIRPGSNMPTSSLLRIHGFTILVDAGLGATRAVCDQGVALTEIDLVIVTHLHSDHYLELGPLLHTAWTAGRTRPLPVIGPAGLSHYWRHFLASMGFDIGLRIADEGRVPLEPLASLATIADGEIWSADGIRIEAIRNYHPPIEESFALKVISGDAVIVLSGDTAPFPGWQDFVEGADILVHEAMLPKGVETVVDRLAHKDSRLKAHILRSHTDAVEIGRLANAAGVGTLVLNHFVPDGLPEYGEADWTEAVRQQWSGPLRIGRDGMRIDF